MEQHVKHVKLAMRVPVAHGHITVGFRDAQHVVTVGIVVRVHQAVQTSVRDAMVPVQVHPVRRCVTIIRTLMLVHRHARPVRRTIRTVAQRRHHTQAAQVV